MYANLCRTGNLDYRSVPGVDVLVPSSEKGASILALPDGDGRSDHPGYEAADA